MEITMYIDADTLGTDHPYPEVFAAYCEEWFARRYPGSDVTVTIGHGQDSLPEDMEGSPWEDYCSLPHSEYERLANVLPPGRRSAYLTAIA